MEAGHCKMLCPSETRARAEDEDFSRRLQQIKATKPSSLCALGLILIAAFTRGLDDGKTHIQQMIPDSEGQKDLKSKCNTVMKNRIDIYH